MDLYSLVKPSQATFSLGERASSVAAAKRDNTHPDYIHFRWRGLCAAGSYHRDNEVCAPCYDRALQDNTKQFLAEVLFGWLENND